MNVGDHSAVARSLCEMLSSGDAGEEAAAAVFEAVANLSVSEETADEIQELALGYMATAGAPQVYHATKFLLSTCTTVEVAKKVSV